jgi:hypothetical protein
MKLLLLELYKYILLLQVTQYGGHKETNVRSWTSIAFLALVLM